MINRSCYEDLLIVNKFNLVRLIHKFKNRRSSEKQGIRYFNFIYYQKGSQSLAVFFELLQ
jgi:hypothetical protein